MWTLGRMLDESYDRLMKPVVTEDPSTKMFLEKEQNSVQVPRVKSISVRSDDKSTKTKWIVVDYRGHHASGQGADGFDSLSKAKNFLNANMERLSAPKSELDEDLRKWFKEKWVRFNPQGKIMGPCARGDDSEGKPKCLPQKKAQALGKKGRASAAARKRREDPNPERSGKAINVNTKSKRKTNENTQKDSIDSVLVSYGYMPRLRTSGNPNIKHFIHPETGNHIIVNIANNHWVEVISGENGLNPQSLSLYLSSKHDDPSAEFMAKDLPPIRKYDPNDPYWDTPEGKQELAWQNEPDEVVDLNIDMDDEELQRQIDKREADYQKSQERAFKSRYAANVPASGVDPIKASDELMARLKRGLKEEQLDELKCWPGYTRVKGVPAGAPGSCKKKTKEDVEEGSYKRMSCPECGGPAYEDEMLAEKKDACYHKVKSRYKVWPSAYGSAALVQCRKKGASNWGNKSKK